MNYRQDMFVTIATDRRQLRSMWALVMSSLLVVAHVVPTRAPGVTYRVIPHAFRTADRGPQTTADGTSAATFG